jgi:LAS superfamily LD-carboxypeptidase LdcB
VRPNPSILAAILVAAIVSVGCSSAEGDDRPTTADLDGLRGAATSTEHQGSSATSSPTASTVPPTTVPPTTVPPTTVPPPEFPRFEPSEYGALLDVLVPSDTVLAPSLPITGNALADDRIRSRAERRGYRLRPVTVVPMAAEGGVAVHPAVVGDLRALRDEAHRLGMVLDLTSGHRSPERQRQIFERELAEEATRLRGRAVSLDEIASGAADDVVDAALAFHSIPGYSRHHSGYTVDFDAGGALSEFEGSPAEVWLRADDFAVAKRFGFVPSYPRESGPQGPEPEPWEYVHVGTGNIRCAALHVPLRAPGADRSCPLVN